MLTDKSAGTQYYYYYRARYYDPALGRFLSEDPLGYKGGDTNLYRYVSGNPVLYTDPSGLDFLDAFEAAIEAIRRWAICKINPSQCGTDPADEPIPEKNQCTL